MNICFTLDYELFLGTATGTVDRCLIQPMNRYAEVAREVGMRFTIFVDASYLHALHREMAVHPALSDDWHRIRQQLLRLQREGHDLQLHIHPQWYYSTFDGHAWRLDTKHYCLYDVPRSEMLRLFRESKQLLDHLLGKHTRAFRAGGFSAQPTALLTQLFAENGLRVDSSVCPGTFYRSAHQRYDYRAVRPDAPYRFADDICRQQPDGPFTEIPLSMCRVSPLFQWRLLVVRLGEKLQRQGHHVPYGDGQSVRTTRASILRRLSWPTDAMATIDGYKINFLRQAIRTHLRSGCESMCVLGHPKLATPHSVEHLAEICRYAQSCGCEFRTFSDLILHEEA